MISSIVQRLLYGCSAIFFALIIVFILSKKMPGDPVANILRTENTEIDSAQYNYLKHKIGLDLPVFYFSINNEKSWQKIIPYFRFNGIKNQFHVWVFGDKSWWRTSENYISKGFIRGDFGINFIDKTPIIQSFWEHFKITFSLSICSVFLVYFIAIPLGLYAGKNKGALFDSITVVLSLLMYAMPMFALATLLVVFFAGNRFWQIIHIHGLGYNEAGFLSLIKLYWAPLLCLSLTGIAYLSRQVRAKTIQVYSEDFVKTARAKGLSEKKILWNHILPNTLFPLVTTFASVFPACISGSLVIEFIFNINGMGLFAYEAIAQRNYHIIYAVFFFTSLLTVLGLLCSDILYILIDPRVKDKAA